MAIITRASGDEGVSAVERRFRHVLIQAQHEVMEAYGVPGTPASVIVLPDATIGSRAALGADKTRSMLLAQARPPEEDGDPAGTSVGHVLSLTQSEASSEAGRR